MPTTQNTKQPTLRRKPAHIESLCYAFTHGHHPQRPTPTQQVTKPEPYPASSDSLRALEHRLSPTRKPTTLYASGLNNPSYMQSYNQAYVPFRPHPHPPLRSKRMTLSGVLEEPQASDSSSDTFPVELDVVESQRAELDAGQQPWPRPRTRRGAEFNSAPVIPDFDRQVFEPLDLDLDGTDGSSMDMTDESSVAVTDESSPDGGQSDMVELPAEMQGICIYPQQRDLHGIQIAELDGAHGCRQEEVRQTGSIRRRNAVRRRGAGSPTLPRKWQAGITQGLNAARRYTDLFEGSRGGWVLERLEVELRRTDSWNT